MEAAAGHSAVRPRRGAGGGGSGSPPSPTAPPAVTALSLPVGRRQATSSTGSGWRTAGCTALAILLTLAVTAMLLPRLRRVWNSNGGGASVVVAAVTSLEGVLQSTNDDMVSQYDRQVVCVCPATRADACTVAAGARGSPVVVVDGLPGVPDGGGRLARRLAARLPALRLLVVDAHVPGAVRFAAALAALDPPVAVAVVIHGGDGGSGGGGHDAVTLEGVLAGIDAGVVTAVGFTDCGAASSFAALGVPAYTVWNAPPQPVPAPDKFSVEDGGVHVGLLGVNTPSDATGIGTQLLAVCPLAGVTLHLAHLPPVAYLRRCRARFLAHGPLAPDAAAHLAARMDVVLHVAVSECTPPSVLHSLAAGVPCLVPPTASAVYDADDVLSRYLVVPEFDNPDAVRDALERTIAARDMLARRGKGLAQWLHTRAAAAWRDFTAAALGTTAGVTELTVPSYMPWQYSTLPPLPPSGGVGGPVRIALLANGGVGTVTAALAAELMAAGHSVLLLGDGGAPELAAWCDAATQPGAGTSSSHLLTCFDMPSLVAAAGGDRTRMTPARQVAAAVAEAYRRTPFDVLELTDQAGLGYELLRGRLTDDAPPAPDAQYLPAAVRIVVRLLDSRHEGDNGRARQWQQAACLEAADWLLAPTPAMRTLFTRVHALHPARALLAPLPLARLTSLAPPAAAAVPDSAVAAVAHVRRVCGRSEGDGGCRVVLVPNDLNDAADTHTVAAALAAAWAPTAGPPLAVHFVFVGSDRACPHHATLVSSCIMREAGAATSHAIILPPLPPWRLAWLVPQLDPAAAIVAPTAGIVNLHAHELAALRVPLIVSDAAPALTDLPPPLTHTYRRGDVRSLVAAISSALRGGGGNDTVTAAATPDAVSDTVGSAAGDAAVAAIYPFLMAATPPPTHPMPLLLAAIDSATATAAARRAT